MNRLTLYSIAFIIAVPLYLILYVTGGLADPVIFLSFLASTFFFIFSFEEKPKKQLEDPLVHFYQHSRINVYGYIMVCSTASVAFIIYIASRNPGFKLGIVSLAMWLLLIIVSYIATQYSNRNFWEDTLTDYILMRMENLYDPHLIGDLVKEILTLRNKEKKTERELLEKIITTDRYSVIKKKDIELILIYSMAYLKTIQQEQELSSDEIKEINAGRL